MTVAGLVLVALAGVSVSQAEETDPDCYGVPIRQERELARSVVRHARGIGIVVADFEFQQPELECRRGEYVWFILAWPKPGIPPGVHGFAIRDADLSLLEHMPAE
jgi:hypothetical protein